MNYYSHVLRFSHPEHLDCCPNKYVYWLGEFVLPIHRLNLHGKLWFSFYGDHYKFRFWGTEESHAKAEIEITRLMQQLGLESKSDESKLTIEEDLGQYRFLNEQRRSHPDQIRARALLVLNYLDSIASLVLDSLTKQSGDWAFELTPDAFNPTDSAFDSLVHMFGNMTRALFPIHESGQCSAWGKFVQVKEHKTQDDNLRYRLYRF